jgi:hypothetical protein
MSNPVYLPDLILVCEWIFIFKLVMPLLNSIFKNINFSIFTAKTSLIYQHTQKCT